MKIEFYTKSSGKSPVTDFIDEQPKRDQAVILAVLEDIQISGFNAKGAIFKQLEGKLWEIKIRSASGGYRFLYVTLNRDQLVVLHAFKKKTQKTTQKDLNIGRKRLRELL